jgi:glycosyltransferase involved in cell wall biosynthesis
VCQWLTALAPSDRPEAIVLSDALLSGMAAALKAATGCPVVCWLQDEHVWTDAMEPALRETVLRTMAKDARDIDRFVAVSAFYAARMTDALALDPERVCVVHPGIDPDRYRPAGPTRRPFVIGYLSRLSAEDGFDRFVDAFLLLRRDPRFADVRIAATGGPSADRRFLRRQLRKLAEAGAQNQAFIDPARFAEDRFAFLSDLSLLSVPGGRSPEAFGYYALEAMAAGVPVVLPAQGAFPEIMAAAGCGTLVAEATPEALARVWADCLTDLERLRSEAEKGRAAARNVFSLSASAAALERVLMDCRTTHEPARLV